MFTSVDGASPGYMALMPHILAPRHVLPPSILGSHSASPPQSRMVQSSLAEVPIGIAGDLAEYAAFMPSTYS